MEALDRILRDMNLFMHSKDAKNLSDRELQALKDAQKQMTFVCQSVSHFPNYEIFAENVLSVLPEVEYVGVFIPNDSKESDAYNVIMSNYLWVSLSYSAIDYNEEAARLLSSYACSTGDKKVIVYFDSKRPSSKTIHSVKYKAITVLTRGVFDNRQDSIEFIDSQKLSGSQNEAILSFVAEQSKHQGSDVDILTYIAQLRYMNGVKDEDVRLTRYLYIHNSWDTFAKLLAVRFSDGDLIADNDTQTWRFRKGDIYYDFDGVVA